MKEDEHERKVQQSVVYEGFGFPVDLVDVPMIKIWGSWIPEMDYNEVSQRLLEAVALKPARLTGSEVRFIRHMFSMSLPRFAKRFGVTHPAVLKWERTSNKATAMRWAVEKDIRLEVLQARAGPGEREFLSAYRAFAKIPAASQERIRLTILQST